MYGIKSCIRETLNLEKSIRWDSYVYVKTKLESFFHKVKENNQVLRNESSNNLGNNFTGNGKEKERLKYKGNRVSNTVTERF